MSDNTFTTKISWAPTIILLMMGVSILIVDYFYSPHLNPEQKSWERAQGVVKDMWYDVNGLRLKKPTSNFGDADRERRIQFAYTIDGIQRTGTQHYIGNVSEVVSLRYPPGHPEKAVLETDPSVARNSWVRNAAGLCLIVIAVLMCCMNALNMSLARKNKSE